MALAQANKHRSSFLPKIYVLTKKGRFKGYAEKPNGVKKLQKNLINKKNTIEISNILFLEQMKYHIHRLQISSIIKKRLSQKGKTPPNFQNSSAVVLSKFS